MTTGNVATATAADGTRLRVLHWPADVAPWATLLIVHGVGEHAGRYEHVAQQMATSGLDVTAYDHRGFGASGGPRAFVDRWCDLQEDLADRVVTLRDAGPDRPLALYGHSLGGLLVVGYLLGTGGTRPLPDAAVVTSPALESTIARWKRASAPLLGRIAPRLRVPNGFGPGSLSRDPEVDRRFGADPLTQLTSTARLGREVFAEQARVRAALDAGDRLPVPTYVIHGTDDPIVPVNASARLAEDPAVTRRVYPGLRHETHNEPEGSAVINDTIAWLRSALGEAGG